MTQPRKVVPGATCLLTRRTVLRHHLFRPDPAMNEAAVYLLAVCARDHGIAVHAFCVMSNHLHVVVTDVRGELPAFLASFHRLLALTTKGLRGWEGAAFDREQTSVVHLETPEAVTDRIGYVLANPVAAGLVRYARDWPGAKSRVADLGHGRLRARRPAVYLDGRNRKWPEEAELTLELPPGVSDAAADSWRDAVADSVAEHEARGRADLAEAGQRFLGAERAQKLSPYERPKSREPLRERNPTFAVGGVPGAYLCAVETLRAFRAAYRAALTKWRAGSRDVVFPLGTWWMVRMHSVVIET